jgi:hypothetical protein
MKNDDSSGRYALRPGAIERVCNHQQHAEGQRDEEPLPDRIQDREEAQRRMDARIETLAPDCPLRYRP